MEDNDNVRLPISRRKVLQGTAGLGAAGWMTDPVAAGGFGGGGGGDGGSPSGGDDDDSGGATTVTLITGQTIRIEEDRQDGKPRRFEVDGADGTYKQFTTDDGLYVIPSDVDLSRFSEELFNVELLVEQGLTDEETDEIPVIITGGSGQVSTASVSGSGYRQRHSFSSINGVAGDVDKFRDTVGQSGDIVDRLSTAGEVDRVYLDARAEASLDAAAPAVNAAAARDEFDVDGSGVTIAVLDTGIDEDHPDFGDRVVDRKDFSGDGLGDRDGHGTHVAGIAAGAGEVEEDLVGMAPGASIMDVKVLDDTGSGAFSDIIAGIEYAVDNGADVINMSLGGPPQDDDPLAAATNTAVENGVLSAAAAGNSFFPSLGGVESPGTAEKATTVAATEADDGIAYFSQKGPSPFDQNLKPEIAAPGADVNAPGSEDAGEYPYTRKGGTSMSAPMVAGIAALIIESGTATAPSDVEGAMVATGERVEGESVFSAGGGEVDAQRAIGSDLRVRDSVVNFRLIEEAATETATVTLENTGDSAIEVDASAELRNIQYAGDSGEDISDQVSVSPGTVTVEAGSTAAVELTVDGGTAFGFNSGYLTFTTGGGETHHTIFGFVRGIRVDVEKIPHPESDNVAGDSLLAYAHNGDFTHLGLVAFDASGQYSFVALDDGGKYTLWSSGELGPADEDGEPTWTIEEVEISPDNASFTIDEGETAPRPLDTSAASEYAPFEFRRFDANVYANYEDGPANSASVGYIGDFGISTAYYTPVAESDPTNVGCFYLFMSENPGKEHVFDVDTGFHFFDGAVEFTPGDAVEVVPDELTKENIRYHRTVEDQFWNVGPGAFPADLVNFPTLFFISFQGDIGPDRVETTWYRNDQTAYDETWGDEGPGFFGRYQLRRNQSVFDGDYFVPEMGKTYDQPFNRDPLTDTLTKWDLSGGDLTMRGQWYGDNSDYPFVVFQYSFGSSNLYSVSVDGSEVASGSSYYWEFPTTTVEDISPGSTIDVSLEGNMLVPTPRETHTESDWQVTYEPGTANTPPQVESIDVRGLSLHNEIPAGHTIVFVDVGYWSDDLDDVSVWYAPTGAGNPFEDASGWAQAATRYVDGGLVGVLVNTVDYSGKLDLAVAATDSDGNSVQKYSEKAVTITEGAGAGAPTTLQVNNVNMRSSRTIPVEITVGGDYDASDVVGDSLRLGAPREVIEGGGAAPKNTKVLGNGTLQAQFPVEGTAFDCPGPVAAQVWGELEDGTLISGADVLEKVTCPGGSGGGSGGSNGSSDSDTGPGGGNGPGGK